MTTHRQAKALLDQLKTANGAVSWQLGKVVNVLLEQAKSEQPGNAALACIGPLKPGSNEAYIANIGASDLRAIVGQIVAATQPSAPSLA